MEDNREGVNLSKKTTKRVVLLEFLIIAVSFFCGFFLHSAISKKGEKRITSASLGSRLEQVSDLTSAELTYDGYLSVIEGSIPLLNEKGFSMRYEAVIRAGIDVSDVDIDVQEDRVIVTLPHADVQSCTVDPDTIQIYDKMYSLFNWHDSYDVVDAIADAQNDALSVGPVRQLKQEADEQSEKIIRGILEEAVGDRELIITFDESKDNQ